MSEEKKPVPIEKSLGYIAWDMKNLVAEVKKANELLSSIAQQKNYKKDLF